MKAAPGPRDLSVVHGSQFPHSLTVPVELSEFQVGDRKVAGTERKELLQKVRAGEVLGLSVMATVYLQPKVPLPLPKRLRAKANLNFARFRDEELADFAGSFTGQVFLRDHDCWSMASVGGRVTESELVQRDGAELFQVRQRLELVKPWAQEDALDGTMRTFSIGWRPKKAGWEGLRESLLCSVCDACLFDCTHWPGDVVKVKNLSGDEEEVIVEALWTKVRGAETSEVAFPAVRGTEVQDVRAALSEMRTHQASRAKEPDVDPEILKALGLGDKATIADAVKAIAAMQASTSKAAQELADERKAHEGTREDLAGERAGRAVEAKQRHEAEVTRLRDEALGDGRLIPDDDSDKLFAELAGESLDRAKRYLSTLKPKVPVGQPLRARGTAPRGTAAAKGKGQPALSESQRKINRKIGLSDEDFMKYGADDQDSEGDEV